MATKKAEQSFDFEKNLQQLNELVDTMEKGDLSLEESLKQFESGMQLSKQCQEALSQAEQKVKILVDKAGKPQLDDFSAGENEIAD